MTEVVDAIEADSPEVDQQPMPEGLTPKQIVEGFNHFFIRVSNIEKSLAEIRSILVEFETAHNANSDFITKIVVPRVDAIDQQVRNIRKRQKRGNPNIELEIEDLPTTDSGLVLPFR